MFMAEEHMFMAEELMFLRELRNTTEEHILRNISLRGHRGRETQVMFLSHVTEEHKSLHSAGFQQWYHGRCSRGQWIGSSRRSCGTGGSRSPPT
jgi:hypothetical protein